MYENLILITHKKKRKFNNYKLNLCTHLKALIN